MRELRNVNNFSDLVEELFSPIVARPFFPSEFLERPMMPLMGIRTDIREDGEDIVFEMDLPGYSKEEINVSLEEGKVLKVSAEKEIVSEENNTYIHRERHLSKISRTFPLKRPVSESDIKAKFENGVLELRIPNVVKEEKKSSKIDIL